MAANCTNGDEENEYDVLENVFDEIEENRDAIVSDLRTYVSFKSIACKPGYVNQTKSLVEAVKEKLVKLDFKLLETPTTAAEPAAGAAHIAQDVILASFETDPSNATILIYAYLDVLAAEKSDGWLFEPFALNTVNDELYGRGVSSGKGQLVCWLNALEAWQQTSNDLPLNVKFVIESMHERNSAGLEAQLAQQSEFFGNVDYVLLFTNSWLDEQQPLVPCNINGCIQFGIEIGCAQDKQGRYFVPSAMTDASMLLNTLVDARNRICVPNIERDCRPISPAEWLLLDSVESHVEVYKKDVRVAKLPHKTKIEMLQHRWCKPSVTMHGIQWPSARSELGTPDKVIAKFSIKLVPKQDAAHVAGMVQDYLKHQFRLLRSRNKLRVVVLDSKPPFCCNTQAPHIAAVCNAMQRVHSLKAILPTTICHFLPIAQMLRQFCAKSEFVFVPYAAFNADNTWAVNESIPLEFYIRNTKLSAAILHQITQMPDQRASLHNVVHTCSRHMHGIFASGMRKSKQNKSAEQNKPDEKQTAHNSRSQRAYQLQQALSRERRTATTDVGDDRTTV